MKSIHLLSGGAAQGLVTQLEQEFENAHQCEIDASFGAVGVMRDSLLAGARCDLVILTDTLVADLTASGHLASGSARAIGVVKTAVAVRTGAAFPAVGTAADLKAALRAAQGIYFPDPVRATAGIHVMRVLKALGLDEELADRFRPYPNGAAAMRAMAESDEDALIGCTQATEIIYTDGVELVAPLPDEFELATTYTAAVASQAKLPDEARQLVTLLRSERAASLRAACGFE